MLNALAKLLKLLNSDASPNQLALAIAFAMFAAFTPFIGLHNLALLFVVCVFRINLSAFFMAFAGFSLLAFAVDPLSIYIGERLLTAPSLLSLWTEMYQSDIWRALMFNHTLMLGSALLSALLWLPTWWLGRRLILSYRERFMQWFTQLKITQLAKASKLFQLYQAIGA